MDGTFQATAHFQVSDIIQKTIKQKKLKGVEMHLECDFFTFQDSNFNPVPPMRSLTCLDGEPNPRSRFHWIASAEH